LAVVELIAATTTKTGLKVESALDTATYEKGIKVSDAEMKTPLVRNLCSGPDPDHASKLPAVDPAHRPTSASSAPALARIRQHARRRPRLRSSLDCWMK
jgi:hypothetical protein